VLSWATPTEVNKVLLEEMASHNYDWSNKRASLKKSGNTYDIDVVDLLASKVDALAEQLDRFGALNLRSSSSMVYEVVYEICVV